MNQPTSAFADWLDTFQTSSQAIQALWLLTASVCLLTLVIVAGRVLRHGISAFAPRSDTRATLVYGVYEAPDGRWLLHAQGNVRELTDDELMRHAATLRRIEGR